MKIPLKMVYIKVIIDRFVLNKIVKQHFLFIFSKQYIQPSVIKQVTFNFFLSTQHQVEVEIKINNKHQTRMFFDNQLLENTHS